MGSAVNSDSYCSVFFTKIKEVFRLSDDFFTDCRTFPQGPDQQAEKLGAAVQPEVPEGPQRGGKQAEKHHAAAQSAQEDVAPQLSVPLAQNEEGQRRASGKAVQQVQRPGHAGTPQPDGPQQVVQQSGGQAQQDGPAEGPQLLRDLKSHGRLAE